MVTFENEASVVGQLNLGCVHLNKKMIAILKNSLNFVNLYGR